MAGAEGFELRISFPASFACARKLRKIGKLWEVAANCLRLLFICFCNINGQITDRFMTLLLFLPHLFLRKMRMFLFQHFLPTFFQNTITSLKRIIDTTLFRKLHSHYQLTHSERKLEIINIYVESS